MQLHQIYGCQMSASQAVAMLRRTGQANRLQARQLLSALVSESEMLPVSLAPLCGVLIGATPAVLTPPPMSPLGAAA